MGPPEEEESAMKILLAVDGSKSSQEVVEQAARLPWPERSEIEILSVAEVPSPAMAGPLPMPGAYYVEWEKALEDQAAATVEQALSQFRAIADPAIAVRGRYVKGNTKEALLDEAAKWGADLIMIGTHGYNPFERMWLGSVSRAITSHASCSVEIVRPREKRTEPGLRLLVGVDGSACSRAAVREVAERPWPAGTEVRLVTAIHLPTTPTIDTWVLPDDYYQQAEQAGREQAEQVLREAEQTLAAVRHRQAILETARKRLGDTRIMAPKISARPTDGDAAPRLSYTVAERFVSEGEIVRASPPAKLFRLIVEDVLKLKAAVPERHATQLKPGQAVELAVESLPGRKVAGAVVRVNPTIDTASRTFEIEVQVPNNERLLKSGAFATASVLVGVDTDAVTVPEESIVRFAGVTKVFAVVDDLAVDIPVTVGTRLDVAGPDGRHHTWIEVTGNFPPNAPVVTSGQSQLAAGSAVRIRKPAPGDSTEPTAGRRAEPTAAVGAAR